MEELGIQEVGTQNVTKRGGEEMYQKRSPEFLAEPSLWSSNMEEKLTWGGFVLYLGHIRYEVTLNY